MDYARVGGGDLSLSLFCSVGEQKAREEHARTHAAPFGIPRPRGRKVTRWALCRPEIHPRACEIFKGHPRDSDDGAVYPLKFHLFSKSSRVSKDEWAASSIPRGVIPRLPSLKIFARWGKCKRPARCAARSRFGSGVGAGKNGTDLFCRRARRRRSGRRVGVPWLAAIMARTRMRGLSLTRADASHCMDSPSLTPRSAIFLLSRSRDAASVGWPTLGFSPSFNRWVRFYDCLHD